VIRRRTELVGEGAADEVCEVLSVLFPEFLEDNDEMVDVREVGLSDELLLSTEVSSSEGRPGMSFSIFDCGMEAGWEFIFALGDQRDNGY